MKSFDRSIQSNRHRRIGAPIFVSLLRELLDGERGLRQTLRAAPPCTQTAPTATSAEGATILGFIPHPDFPDEVLVTPAPLRGTMSPVAALSRRRGKWVAHPQIVRTSCLEEYEVIAIEPVEWIDTLATLAADFRARGDWHNPDFRPWEIATAWPDWQAAKLAWPARAEDLAARLGTNPMPANSLLVKCRRLGLTQVTR